MAAKKCSFVCAILAAVLLNILGQCEMSVYPGLRRKPLQQQLQSQYEVPPDFLAQLMEENARRRLQQQFEQQLEIINMQLQRQRQLLERDRYRQRQEALQALEESETNGGGSDSSNMNININNQYDQYDENVEFDYNLNNNRYANIIYNSNSDNNQNNYLRERQRERDQQRERIPFAVGPSDIRFYATESDQSEELDTQALSEYEEYKPVENKLSSTIGEKTDKQSELKNNSTAPVSAPVLAPVAIEPSKPMTDANFYRIKPQSAAAAAVVSGVNLPSNTMNKHQHEINALIDKLQKQSKTNSKSFQNQAALANQDGEQLVLRQHLGMGSELGVYIVALIAGVSAAVTVGLIALAITWMHNRSKATADVDYPAYGITGPNKDISPSGDRKLAQSAQMYHYQHQKQQIIAMENRQCNEGSCVLSDVESDDDNEEGDYTVYECPGLAPTGEMEVKNPLFLDETPATPATGAGTGTGASANATNNITQATPQQPPTLKKCSLIKGNNPNTNLTTTASSSTTITTPATTAPSEDKNKRKPRK